MLIRNELLLQTLSLLKKKNPSQYWKEKHNFGNKVEFQWTQDNYNLRMWKCQSLSHVRFFAIPWTVACQPPLFLGFPRQEYWSGKLCPPLGDFPKPRTEPRSPALLSGKNTGVGSHALLQGIFLTQGSNPGLLHYHLSNQGNPIKIKPHKRWWAPNTHSHLYGLTQAQVLKVRVTNRKTQGDILVYLEYE